MEIRHVLVPVDFSTLTERELGLAIEVCRAFGARLVLHHNDDNAPPALARAWDWKRTHPEVQDRNDHSERAMRELLGRVSAQVPAEATMSRGLVLTSILQLAASVPADLIVMGSHGGDGDDHASITERIIAQSSCPVLALQEGVAAERPLRLDASSDAAPTTALVPIDLSAATAPLLDYAFTLARRLPLRLRLLHVIAGRHELMAAAVAGHGGSPAGLRLATEAARERLAALVPPDLTARVQCEVEVGNAPERIVAACAGADFVIMGEHARGLWGWLAHDTARDLLRRAPCPVWYVPPSLPA